MLIYILFKASLQVVFCCFALFNALITSTSSEYQAIMYVYTVHSIVYTLQTAVFKLIVSVVFVGIIYTV